MIRNVIDDTFAILIRFNALFLINSITDIKITTTINELTIHQSLNVVRKLSRKYIYMANKIIISHIYVFGLFFFILFCFISYS